MHGCDEQSTYSPSKSDLLSKAASDRTPAPAHTLLVLDGKKSTFSSVGQELVVKKGDGRCQAGFGKLMGSSMNTGGWGL